MEVYIRYRRIKKTIDEDKFDEFFENLIKDGWEIVYYQEDKPIIERKSVTAESVIEFIKIPVTLVVGRKQNNVL
mgnify:CR=1 FL=1|jgi:hypothetical protein